MAEGRESFNILRQLGIEQKNSLKTNDFSGNFVGLIDPLVTPERFILQGVNILHINILDFSKNHGCSLFADPDISMFFVYLQRKFSDNSLISGYFRC